MTDDVTWKGRVFMRFVRRVHWLA